MTTTLAGVPPLPQLQEDDLTLRQVSTRSGGEVRILNKGIEDRGFSPSGTDALGHQHLAFHTALELTLYRFYNLQALVAVLRIKYQNFSKCFLP